MYCSIIMYRGSPFLSVGAHMIALFEPSFNNLNNNTVGATSRKTMQCTFEDGCEGGACELGHGTNAVRCSLAHVSCLVRAIRHHVLCEILLVVEGHL